MAGGYERESLGRVRHDWEVQENILLYGKFSNSFESVIRTEKPVKIFVLYLIFIKEVRYMWP